MADFEQTIDWPSWVLSNVDVLTASRARLAAIMHAQVQAIADKAQEQYAPFASVADNFYVGDDFGAILTVGIGNDAAKWPFVEYDTQPHEVPPMHVPIGPLTLWADAHGANPFAVQHKIDVFGFEHPGTKGKHILEGVWNDEIGNLETAIDEAYLQMMETWGAI